MNPARLYAKRTRAVARETRGNARPREPTALHKIYLALVQRVVVRDPSFGERLGTPLHPPPN